MSRTLAIIKPNAFDKALEIKQLISRDYVILKEISGTLEEDLVKELYKEHKTKPFYNKLCEFSTSGPCVIMILERIDAVDSWRRDLKTLRSKYSGSQPYENGLHGSDCDIAARREIGLFFGISAYLI